MESRNMVSNSEERLHQSGLITVKEEQYEKSCSSGYDTLSGQTTECDAPRDSKSLTKTVICDGSASEDEINNEFSKNIPVRRKKPRQNRRTPTYRDVLEADVDSDTTIDSYCDGVRDKAHPRKPTKKRHGKHQSMNAKSVPRVHDSRVQRNHSDPGLRYRREKMHVSKGNAKTEDISDQCSYRDDNDDSDSPRHLSPEFNNHIDSSGITDARHSTCLVGISGDECSENNSTVGYPSDTISSESSIFANMFKPKYYDDSYRNDFLLAENGAKGISTSLSSTCTSPVICEGSKGTLGIISDSENQFSGQKGRPESIQSYEELIEKIDKKLKQTENLRTVTENESLKADLLSIQEQIRMIKINSLNGSIQANNCSVDSNSLTTEDNQFRLLKLNNTENIEVYLTRGESDKSQFHNLQRVENRKKHCRGAFSERTVEDDTSDRSCIRGCGHQQRKLSSDHTVTSYEHERKCTDTGRKYSHCISSDHYGGLDDEISAQPSKGGQLRRRRSDPTGLSSKIIRTVDLEPVHHPPKLVNTRNNNDVWFGLYGKPTHPIYSTRAHDFHDRDNNVLIPSGVPLQSSASVKFIRSHCRGSTRSDNRVLAHSVSCTTDTEIESDFVYPQRTALNDQITRNSNQPVERRQRAPRIRYVDNSEAQAIMESLSSANKRKKADEHNTVTDKEAKKPKASLIKRVKAGLSVRRAFSKLKLHKSSNKTTRNKKLDASYTSQWVGVASSSDEDHQDVCPLPIANNNNTSDNALVWMDYRDDKQHQVEDSGDDPDIDPLAHLESSRSQRRGSLIKRIKKWYHSRSRSAENVSTLSRMHDRFEILNISDSPRRLGSNGPLVNNVIRNRSRSEENLPSYYNEKRREEYGTSSFHGVGNHNMRFVRAESSQSLVDTKVVRFLDTNINDSPLNAFQDPRSTHVTQPRQRTALLDGDDMHSHVPQFMYSSRGRQNCGCCYCVAPVPPVPRFHHHNYPLPWYTGDVRHHFDNTFDSYSYYYGPPPSRPPSRRHSRSKPARPSKYERVVPPLEMTVTHEKKAETRKLTVQHTFV